jgi:hypothetical protein
MHGMRWTLETWRAIGELASRNQMEDSLQETRECVWRSRSDDESH